MWSGGNKTLTALMLAKLNDCLWTTYFPYSKDNYKGKCKWGKLFEKQELRKSHVWKSRAFCTISCTDESLPKGTEFLQLTTVRVVNHIKPMTHGNSGDCLKTSSSWVLWQTICHAISLKRSRVSSAKFTHGVFRNPVYKENKPSDVGNAKQQNLHSNSTLCQVCSCTCLSHGAEKKDRPCNVCKGLIH